MVQIFFVVKSFQLRPELNHNGIPPSSCTRKEESDCNKVNVAYLVTAVCISYLTIKALNYKSKCLLENTDLGTC